MQFQSSYQNYKTVWPSARVKVPKGYTKVCIKLIWNFYVKNISASLQYNKETLEELSHSQHNLCESSDKYQCPIYLRFTRIKLPQSPSPSFLSQCPYHPGCLSPLPIIPQPTPLPSWLPQSPSPSFLSQCPYHPGWSSPPPHHSSANALTILVVTAPSPSFLSQCPYHPGCPSPLPITPEPMPLPSWLSQTPPHNSSANALTILVVPVPIWSSHHLSSTEDPTTLDLCSSCPFRSFYPENTQHTIMWITTYRPELSLVTLSFVANVYCFF